MHDEVGEIDFHSEAMCLAGAWPPPHLSLGSSRSLYRSLPRTSPPGNMPTINLRKHYNNYIDAINKGCQPGTLDPFVNEGIIHNDSQPLSIAEYTKIITDSQKSFLNLDFEIQQLVVDAEDDSGTGNVAVRIKLTFHGKESNVMETFYEHVFYRFEAGKIMQVWSLLDGAGLEWAKKRKEGQGT
jgi:predicted ester cyclase